MAAFDRDVTLHRPSALLRALAASPLLLSLDVLVQAALGRAPHSSWIPLLVDPVIFSVLASLFLVRRNPRPERVPVRLLADADGVSIDGARVLERRKVRRGYVQPWGDRPPTVRLVGRSGLPLLEVEVADEDEGHALLDAMRLGVSHQATRFSGKSPLRATKVGRVALPFLVGGFVSGASFLAHHFHFFLAPVVPLLAVAMSAALFAVPSSIHVGADGILVTWLWRRRYYSFSDIAGVRLQGRAVRLWLHSGEAIDLAGASGGRALDRMRVAALVARVQAALDAARQGKLPTNVAALVARGGRTTEDWARAVRSILGGDGGGDYRSNAVPEENLWRVTEDPTAEETARVGAAVALRAKLDDDGRARMLRVAEASVSPKVRVALRAAAGVEDDAVLEALASYEAALGDSGQERGERSKRALLSPLHSSPGSSNTPS